MRDRLIERIRMAKMNRGLYSSEGYLMGASFSIPLVENKYVEHLADHLLANGVIVLPCKVGDKVAVRASCECVSMISYYDECRSSCPFEDDCECDECDNTNERIFDTEISSIFCDSQGWKITFEHLAIIEARLTDMGTSFFVGENAHEQAIEYEKALAERSENGNHKKS